MARRALVIGGTGPTGPHIVDGLLERGFDVTIFHRGTHEATFAGPVQHLHGDPHFVDSARDVIGDRRFDLAIVTYGRTRVLLDVLAGRCEHVIGIGAINVYRGASEPSLCTPHGTPLLVDERGPFVDVPPVTESAAELFSSKIFATELRAFELQDEGAFVTTWFRYPIIYGPRNIIPWEWSVLRRIEDGRKRIVVADGGLAIKTRAAGRNAAHAVLLAVDHPLTSGGQSYNCGDDQQYSVRQWIEMVALAAGGELEIVSVPSRLARPAWPLLPAHSTGSPHHLLDTTKCRHELGYRDAISTADALAESIAWYRENPVTDDSHNNVDDLFDYEFEDQLLERYEDAMRGLEEELAIEPPTIVHHYAHPKEPNLDVDHRGR